MAEITTVDEPLLSPAPVTVPAMSTGGDGTPERVPALLALFAGRRGASLLVRETVALELDDYREDWGYSFPVVVTETLWNLTFVVVSFAMLIWIAREETNVKLRIWICGYSMQCVVHVVLLWLEYKRRSRRISSSSTVPSLTSGDSSADDVDRLPLIRRLEKVNTLISYLWWVIGFILMLESYDNHGTLRLFWLTLVFLAMDVFFLVIHTLFFILLTAAYCFCLPCIFGLMYYISWQERASEADISNIPKYTFEILIADVEQPDLRTCKMVPVETNGLLFSTERVLPTDNVECCICLRHYEDREQLVLLRCNHHFHSTCITKWLRIKATCPVCKSLVS